MYIPDASGAEASDLVSARDSVAAGAPARAEVAEVAGDPAARIADVEASDLVPARVARVADATALPEPSALSIGLIDDAGR